MNEIWHANQLFSSHIYSGVQCIQSYKSFLILLIKLPLIAIFYQIHDEHSNVHASLRNFWALLCISMFVSQSKSNSLVKTVDFSVFLLNAATYVPVYFSWILELQYWFSCYWFALHSSDFFTFYFCHILG